MGIHSRDSLLHHFLVHLRVLFNQPYRMITGAIIMLVGVCFGWAFGRAEKAEKAEK